MPPVTKAPATGRLAHPGPGVYVADAGAGLPPRLTDGGRRLSRFMDSIYLDRPCEKLSVKKIQVLNAARRPLLDRREIGSVNTRVRAALAAGVLAAGAKRVLEWGCGYHPMHALLADVGYEGLDVDRAVVVAGRAAEPELIFHDAERGLRALPDGGFDAVVSAFVFHFRLPRPHLEAMRRVLGPGGIVLANVYRRSQRSRRQLLAELERAGLRATVRKDGEQLCADHEFWCLTRSDDPDRGRAGAVLDRVQEAVSRDRPARTTPGPGRPAG